ncbi:MAG TPA: DUF4190 domain-containing protein [Propionibacteriaceae bacterium]
MSERQTPNPFSREGSQPTEGFSADPDAGTTTPRQYPSPSGGPNDPGTADWPSYPQQDPYGRPTANPYGMPGESYGSPSANSMYAGPAHGFNPDPTPPYADPSQSYGQSSGYGSTPYEANPYQPAFGGVTPYGVMRKDATPTTQHPQATQALILGILGTVLGVLCVVGGLLGIGGIVVGRRVRNEIDADPGRYTGRSQAIAGIVTGIVGVSIFALVTVLIVLAVVLAITSSGL